MTVEIIRLISSLHLLLCPKELERILQLVRPFVLTGGKKSEPKQCRRLIYHTKKTTGNYAEVPEKQYVMPILPNVITITKTDRQQRKQRGRSVIESGKIIQLRSRCGLVFVKSETFRYCFSTQTKQSDRLYFNTLCANAAQG